MAGLDDLYARIPTADIARQLGVDESEVDSAVGLLVPVLVGGLHQNAQDPDRAGAIESAVSDHAARGLVGAGSAEQADGQQAIAKIFGGGDTGQVANALSGAGAADGELLQKLLPIIAPIVLAYIGQQMTQHSAPGPAGEKGSAGGLNDVLGSILSGMSGSDDKSLGSVLGKVLGNQAGQMLGGLFGGKK